MDCPADSLLTVAADGVEASMPTDGTLIEALPWEALLAQDGLGDGRQLATPRGGGISQGTAQPMAIGSALSGCSQILAASFAFNDR